jgi:ABC-type transport system involved in cytochrome bd biosynthesis fused ATPase/permease subunit
MCGLAGALLVNHTAYLTPEFMNWTRSGELMFMVIMGGMATSAGPVLGAFALLLLEDVLSALTRTGRSSSGRSSCWSCSSSSAASPACFPGRKAMAESLLEVRALRKAFGALQATDGVDLEVREGETHAVIGPNGAGKTTLIGQLSGMLRPIPGRSVSPARTLRAARPRALEERPRALVPDHQHLPRVHRAGQRGARRAGARRA